MFAINNFAKVWKVYPKKTKDQKFTLIQLSTSKRNKDGSYVTDFSGNVSLVGEAEKKASTLEADDRIKMLRVGVTNFYNKESGQTTTNYMIFDFEFNEDKKQKEVTKKDDDPDAWMTADIDESNLPFN